MADWFPATRALLQRKLGPHLPPHPLQAVFGAALSALAAALVLGVLWLGGRAVTAARDGVLYLAASVQRPAPVPETPPQGDSAPEPARAPEPRPAVPAAAPKAPVQDPGPLKPLPLGISQQVREKVRPAALPFREGDAATLADGVRQTDYALIQTLARLGLDRSRAASLFCATYSAPPGSASSDSAPAGEPYFFQRIRLYLGGPPEDFVRALRESLEVWAERTTLRLDADGVLRLAVDGHPTHELFFSSAGAIFVPPPQAGEPRLTVVIDDLGESMEAARALLDLDLPVTFGILPRTAHAAETAAAAHKAGQEVIIHQPMEPRQAPYVNPGPGALTLAMPPEAMRRVLRENIARVPHAVGMNNHMGSRLTGDAEACRLVSREASAAGFFILDSVTFPSSDLQTEALRLGVRALRRDVFLDDGTPPKAVVLQNLRDAERLAKRRGQAVVIGHPRPETLAALKEWARQRDAAVAVVPLRYQSTTQTGGDPGKNTDRGASVPRPAR